MAREAVTETRDPQAGPAARSFYHGVETAALHVLRPEMAAVHEGTPWLDLRDVSFRDGFLEASDLLATAAAARVPPLRVRLPQPRVPRR